MNSNTETSSRRKLIWLDCDPGHYDALAIILAGHSSNIELLGISTVAGNQTLEKTTENALKILSVSGLQNIDVVKGQSTPLVRPSRICPEIHGNSGLDCSTVFPVLTKGPISKKAVLHIFEVLSKATHPVILVATGCLTNYALLLTLYPEIKPKIEQLILLGGAMGIGNISPVAEFNILIDPEAAKIVFEAGLNLVQIPLEVTHTALVTPSVIFRIQEMKTVYSDLIVDLLNFFAETYKKVFHFEYPPLHDPLAVLYAIDPSLFQTTLMRVDIETQSEMCSGQTICDVYNMSLKPKNAYVAQKVNVEAFWDHMINALKLANGTSILNK